MCCVLCRPVARTDNQGRRCRPAPIRPWRTQPAGRTSRGHGRTRRRAAVGQDGQSVSLAWLVGEETSPLLLSGWLVHSGLDRLVGDLGTVGGQVLIFDIGPDPLLEPGACVIDRLIEAGAMVGAAANAVAAGRVGVVAARVAAPNTALG